MGKYVFLRTVDLEGDRLVYRLPKDINDMVLSEYLTDREVVKSLYYKALITVPAARYDKEGNVKLKVVKVEGVFTSDKSIYWRCRGQFVPYLRWYGSLENVKGCFSYMSHDYTAINQARIRRDLLKWYKRERLG